MNQVGKTMNKPTYLADSEHFHVSINHSSLPSDFWFQFEIHFPVL